MHREAPTHLKVDVPNSVTCVNEPPMYERYVVRCGFKNKYQEDMCLKEIGLHGISKYDNHYRLNGQSSYEVGNLDDHLMGMKIFTLIINKIFIQTPKSVRKGTTASNPSHTNRTVDMLREVANCQKVIF